jgi:molecular chaperone GrpE (heat shock protein)
MTNNEIVEQIKKEMISFFKKHNLEELKEGVNNLNLHIHGPISFGDIIYVCDH